MHCMSCRRRFLSLNIHTPGHVLQAPAVWKPTPYIGVNQTPQPQGDCDKVFNVEFHSFVIYYWLGMECHFVDSMTWLPDTCTRVYAFPGTYDAPSAIFQKWCCMLMKLKPVWPWSRLDSHSFITKQLRGSKQILCNSILVIQVNEQGINCAC